jgi:hypothetical protein
VYLTLHGSGTKMASKDSWSDNLISILEFVVNANVRLVLHSCDWIHN